MNDYIESSKFKKIIVPSESYNFKSDTRKLVPYECAGNIGFINQEGKIVVHPKYASYIGDCYTDNDIIIVGKWYLYGIPINKKSIKNNLKILYGIINSSGKEIIAPKYTSILQSLSNKDVFTVQNTSHLYGVIDTNEHVIVPFGKYKWISGFDKGYAKAKAVILNSVGVVKEKWGIVNEKGDVVLPFEYDNIWNFYTKSWNSTPIFKDNKQYRFYFKTGELHD